MEEEDDMMNLNEKMQNRDLSNKNKWLVFPDSSLRGFLDMLVFIAVLYSSLMLPFGIAFDKF
jgi:hypothetical protein